MKSHTLQLNDDCQLAVTLVRQGQQEIKRDWARWTLTITFEDDVNSSAIDGVVGGLVSLFGIRAEGVVDIVSGLGGTVLSITDAFGDAKNRHIFVSRETAASENLWLDSGTPSSELLYQEQLPPLLCEIFTGIMSDFKDGKVTIPVDHD